MRTLLSFFAVLSLTVLGDPLLSDNAEHGLCYGYNTHAASLPQRPPLRATCKIDGSGNVALSDEVTHSGSLSYKLAVYEDDLPQPGFTGGIHTAKMAPTSPAVRAAQQSGARLEYSAYFFVASGFDDTHPGWHIQMQWKGVDANRVDADRFWLAQNPKISWGFHLAASAPSLEPVLQITATIREAYSTLVDCTAFSYDRLNRENTLGLSPIPVPRNEWIKVTTELFFHDTRGSLRIWQGSGDEKQLVVDAQGINTVSQLVPADIAKSGDSPCDPELSNSHFWNKPSNFVFQISNYLSGYSFMPEHRSRDEPHILFVDDILIRERAHNPPQRPTLLH